MSNWQFLDLFSIEMVSFNEELLSENNSQIFLMECGLFFLFVLKPSKTNSPTIILNNKVAAHPFFLFCRTGVEARKCSFKNEGKRFFFSEKKSEWIA